VCGVRVGVPAWPGAAQASRDLVEEITQIKNLSVLGLLTLQLQLKRPSVRKGNVHVRVFIFTTQHGVQVDSTSCCQWLGSQWASLPHPTAVAGDLELALPRCPQKVCAAAA